MRLADFDAILFDKDGTIFDSEQVCCDAWVKTAKEFNVYFTADMYKKFIGVPTKECYEIAHRGFGSAFPMGLFIQAMSEYISQQKQKGLPIKKGFELFFHYIVQRKIPVGVVTSSSYESALESFYNTEYRQALDVLVTFDDIEHPKPAPDCYLLACKALAVQPARTLVFEDSSAGVTAALAAGCQTVFIPDLVDIGEALISRCLFTATSFEQVYEVMA